LAADPVGENRRPTPIYGHRVKPRPLAGKPLITPTT
jgi:hypothetical protein